MQSFRFILSRFVKERTTLCLDYDRRYFQPIIDRCPPEGRETMNLCKKNVDQWARLAHVSKAFT